MMRTITIILMALSLLLPDIANAQSKPRRDTTKDRVATPKAQTPRVQSKVVKKTNKSNNSLYEKILSDKDKQKIINELTLKSRRADL